MNSIAPFLSWLSKELVYGIIITWCSVFSAFGQTNPAATERPDIVDTAAKPMVFAEGVVSTPYTEWATSFTPDGNTVYFSQGAIYWTICFSKRVDGKWTKPEVANISGKWVDTDPFISPDGKRMIFMSNRPLPGAAQDKHQPNYHLWYADLIADNKWGEPVHLPAPINMEGVNNYAPSISSSGTLFFCSRDREGHAGMSSYSAKWLGDHFDQPKLLALNGKEETQDPFVAPDESYIVFVSGNDLYISYRNADGYTTGQKLGKPVNNGDSNSSPCISRDGKMLYYSSSRMQGMFTKRDPKNKALDYDGLVKEMNTVFNGQDNILVIPVDIAKKNS